MEATKKVTKEDVQQTQYLTFNIASEEYGVNILQIKEIIEFGKITKIPTTPLWIRGVINLRGSVVPVVDLAVKFTLPESQITRFTCIVIVEVTLDGEKTIMGIMADTVNQVIDLRLEDIEKPPSFGTKIRVDYLIGMGKLEDKFVMILDIDQVLSLNELLAVVAIQETETLTKQFSESEVKETTDQEDNS